MNYSIIKVCFISFLLTGIITIVGCKKEQGIISAKSNETALSSEVKILRKPLLLNSPEIGTYYAKGSVISAADCPDCGVFNDRFVVPGPKGKFSTIRGFVSVARVASNRTYHMDFQLDGNLVLYHGNDPLWASRKLTPTNNALGATSFVEFTPTGDVYCRNESLGVSYWGAGITIGGNRAIWILQDDANFVGYTDYIINTKGDYVITGEAFAGTNTAGGKYSNRSGRLR